MHRILTIESTCDETAAAIVAENLSVLGACVATQDDLHERFHGVVPEIAARAHLERILPVIDRALQASRLSLADLDAIAVATTPGLANSLLVGLMAAKSLAFAIDRPLISINHLHAHVYACQVATRKNVFPCLGMIVSGGHTHMYRYLDAVSPEFLGGTIDDAAGEAFDKVATMLGLGFPGGPQLAQLAESGDPRKYAFPRSFFKDDQITFSFSGLKTAVRYELAGYGAVDFSKLNIPREKAADVAASFQAAVVDVLVTKARLAMKQTGLRRLCVGGGVAANRVFREQLELAAREDDFELLVAPPELCTDNAVMGAIAFEKFQRGQFEPLTLDIEPGLIR